MYAFEPYNKFKADYPEDFEKIKSYLLERGKINVNDATLEDFYYNFSDDIASAVWLNPTSDYLERFADWLVEMEI